MSDYPDRLEQEYDKVCAERDRLRDEVSEWKRRAVEVMDRGADAATERDRLRAVVDALRGYLSWAENAEVAAVPDDLRAKFLDAESSEATDG
jgi:hypothetical protein